MSLIRRLTCNATRNLLPRAGHAQESFWSQGKQEKVSAGQKEVFVGFAIVFVGLLRKSWLHLQECRYHAQSQKNAWPAIGTVHARSNADLQ